MKSRIIFTLIFSVIVLSAMSQQFVWVQCGNDSLCFIIPRVGDTDKVMFAGCKNSTLLNIPANITFENKTYEVNGIAFQALTGNRKVTEIIVPSSVRVIESSAFEGCMNLKKISIAAGVTTLGDYVFQDCTSLRDCVLPESVKTIGEALFRGCDHLKSVTLPCALTEIPYKMFMGCFKLQTLNIPTMVSHIGDYAFCNCTMLRSLVIPDKAVIEKRALQGCAAASQYANRIKQ